MSHLEKWTVLDSKYLLESPWLNVRRDRCRMRNGHVLEEYYVQESSDGIVVFALNLKREVLLVRQYRHGTGKFHLDLPGGRIGRSDTSPIACARRELLEETGFEAENFEVIGRLALHPPTSPNYNYIVFARNATQFHRGGLCKDEDIQYKLLPLNQVLELVRLGEIDCNICVAAIYSACEKIGVIRFGDYPK